jgi:hypothetical protein
LPVRSSIKTAPGPRSSFQQVFLVTGGSNTEVRMGLQRMHHGRPISTYVAQLIVVGVALCVVGAKPAPDEFLEKRNDECGVGTRVVLELFLTPVRGS